MMRCVSIMFILVSLVSNSCEGKINLPAGGDTLISLHGAQVKIRWSFDDPIPSVLYRLWSFSNNGKKAELLARITDDDVPLILNSSLPGVAIEKPATLVLKKVDLRYNGTYHFTLYHAVGAFLSHVSLFIAVGPEILKPPNISTTKNSVTEQLTTRKSITTSQDYPTTAGSEELKPSTGIATNRNVPTIKNSVTGSQENLTTPIGDLGTVQKVVDQIIDNKDTVTIMPTGAGKSICYWIPGLATIGVTVVTTPLVALLNDQVAKLRNYGVSVCYVTSSMLPEERDMIFHELTKEAPRFKFVYLTPESALSPQVTACFEQMTANKSLSRFVVDEAHCIDTWGQSFRPSYGCLSKLKQFGQPIAAFTGTATAQTHIILYI